MPVTSLPDANCQNSAFNQDVYLHVGTGSSCINGTVSRTTPQTAGQWTCSGQKPGILNSFPANSWNYNPGTFATNLIFVLAVI